MLKKIIPILSFVGAFFVVRYGMEYYQETSALQKVDKQYEMLQEQAKIDNPNEPEVIGMQKAAINLVSRKINALTNSQEKARTAAGTFFGFYLVNVKERNTYCTNQGADILPFITAFKSAHSDEYNKAISILSYDSNKLNEIYNILQPKLNKIIANDMALIAKNNGVSLKEACALLSANSMVVVSEMHISKTQPVVHKALMAEF